MSHIWFLSAMFVLFQEGPGQPVEQPLYCVLPESLLDHDFIQGQLASGLTTTILITCEHPSAPRDQAPVVFRIDIRFEPWDEVYIVDVWQREGGYQRERLTGLTALRTWWNEPRLILAKPLRSDHYRNRSWSVRLEIRPFSRSETRRARAWLAASGSSDQQNDRKSWTSSDRKARTGMINTLLASSIRQKVLFRTSWRLQPESP